MTIAAWARPRRRPQLPPPAVRLLAVDEASQVRADCYWQADRPARPTVLGLHGLEGSSEAHYMRGLADKAWARGWNVILLNQRNCGGTEHLSPTLYHSGLTADPLAVLRALHAETPFTRIGIVGYSLGGNLTLKLAAERDAHGDLPIAAVAAVSPTIDLALCVEAIERPVNRLYQWNFMRGLRARLRLKARHFPERYDLAPLRAVRTIREFDDAYTAPHAGFGTAARYYAQASALRTAADIRIPALIIASGDDPFVPMSQFEQSAIRTNPSITVSAQRHGGHCGFIARGGDQFDGYWAEREAVEFLGLNGL